MASNNGDGFFYLYIVNDYNTAFTAQFNLPPAWKISDQTQILVETVSGNFWGEISTITNTINGIGSVWIDQYSTTRLAIQTGIQKVQTISATLSCTARAGVLSSQTYCSNLPNSDTFIYSGTSNTAFHEQTTVSLLSFPLTNYRPNQRSVLKLMFSNIIGNQSTLVQVLGITNTSFSLNSNSASWNGLSSLLVPLNDGTLIGNISQNFINWSSPGSFSLAGHIVAANQTKNQIEMIDVTEYVNKINSLGGNQLNFLVYRPFRHPTYVNPIPVAGDKYKEKFHFKIYYSLN